ncbi:antA/AntB antirepressor family protein [Bartonella tribocorum]|nr:antA/AntB antirepressor family protein [Bartonella tribocorum]
MHRHLQLQQDFDTWFNDHVEKLELKKGVHFVFTKKRRKAKKGLSKI